MNDQRTYEVPVFKLQLVQEGTIHCGPVTDPRGVATLLEDIAKSDREQMVAVFLNAKNHPVGRQTISIGTLNATLVSGREVYKGALAANTNAIILGHNHPSGVVTPSQEDNAVTKAIAGAGQLLQIALLDHVILSPDGGHYSYREQNPELLKGGE